YTQPIVTYVGEDASEQFLHCMIQEQGHIQTILKSIQPLNLSPEEEQEYDSTPQCCICEQLFSLYDEKYGTVVRHHNHLTGKFIGTAHNVCNINCKQAEFIPVVFHNLRGYDSHLIMQSVGLLKDSNIKCIANNMEKYISFSLGSLKFIDSLQFMNSSLEKLVENLKLSGDQCFKIFFEDFPNREHADLLLRKGKTLQKCRKYVDVKLAHTEKKLQKYVARPTFQRMKIFRSCGCRKQLHQSKLRTTSLLWNDLAKFLMYNYYFNHLKPTYRNNLTLLATDTDSFMYYVETQDVYRDMLQKIYLYQQIIHCLQMTEKKKIGVFKDELGGVPMKEFVALRPKMYSSIYDKNDKEINEKSCKGISRSVVKRELMHEHYKDTLLRSTQTKHTMFGLHSDHHIMYCDKITNISLSAFDDKRYWFDDGIGSVAYGHYALP
ncbi:hypothetical protein MAR_021070, partial [Mya arenaria]